MGKNVNSTGKFKSFERRQGNLSIEFYKLCCISVEHDLRTQFANLFLSSATFLYFSTPLPAFLPPRCPGP